MNKPDCYVARCPDCDRIVCIYVIDCTDKKDQARTMAKWVRDGLIVGSTTSEEFRSRQQFGHVDSCGFEAAFKAKRKRKP